jgi:hypothetical protein
MDCGQDVGQISKELSGKLDQVRDLMMKSLGKLQRKVDAEAEKRRRCEEEVRELRASMEMHGLQFQSGMEEFGERVTENHNRIRNQVEDIRRDVEKIVVKEARVHLAKILETCSMNSNSNGCLGGVTDPGGCEKIQAADAEAATATAAESDATAYLLGSLQRRVASLERWRSMTPKADAPVASSVLETPKMTPRTTGRSTIADAATINTLLCASRRAGSNIAGVGLAPLPLQVEVPAPSSEFGVLAPDGSGDLILGLEGSPVLTGNGHLPAASPVFAPSRSCSPSRVAPRRPSAVLDPRTCSPVASPRRIASPQRLPVGAAQRTASMLVPSQTGLPAGDPLHLAPTGGPLPNASIRVATPGKSHRVSVCLRPTQTVLAPGGATGGGGGANVLPWQCQWR